MGSASELPDLLTFDSLDIKIAEEVFEKMRSASELPDVVKFNSLDIKKAAEVFEQMKSASELPDVLKCNSLIGGGRTQHGETKKAEEI